MKSNYLILAMFAMTLTSCAMNTAMTNSNSYTQDDIYYVPTNNNSYTLSRAKNTPNNSNSSTSKNTYNQAVTTEYTNTGNQVYFNTNSRTKTYYGNNNTYYIKGYWLNDFIGSDNDLEEAYNMISRYPQGFSVAAAGSINAIMDISFDSDWNVFSDGDRYWWFPSNQNFNYYSIFMFGNYANYIYAPFIYSPYVGISYNRFASSNRRYNRGFSINFGIVNPWYLNSLSMNSFNYYNGYYDNYYNGYGYYDNWGRWNYGRPYYYGHNRYGSYYDNKYIRHYGGYTTWYKPYRTNNHKRDPYGQRPNIGNGVNQNTQRYNNGRIVHQNGTTVKRSSTGRVIRPNTSTTVRRPTRTNTTRSTARDRSTTRRNKNSSVNKSSSGRVIRPTKSTTARRPTKNTTNRGTTTVRRPLKNTRTRINRGSQNRVIRPITRSSNKNYKSNNVRRNSNINRVIKSPTRTVRRNTYTPTRNTRNTRSNTTNTIQRTINRSNNSGRGGRIRRK